MLRRRSNDLKLSARWPLSHLREGPPAFGGRGRGRHRFLPRSRAVPARSCSWPLALVPGFSRPFSRECPTPTPSNNPLGPISRSIWGTLEELACFCALWRASARSGVLWRALARSGTLSRALARPGGLDEVSPGSSAPRDPVLARVQQCSRPGTAIPNELKRSPNSLAV